MEKNIGKYPPRNYSNISQLAKRKIISKDTLWWGYTSSPRRVWWDVLVGIEGQSVFSVRQSWDWRFEGPMMDRIKLLNHKKWRNMHSKFGTWIMHPACFDANNDQQKTSQNLSKLETKFYPIGIQSCRQKLDWRPHGCGLLTSNRCHFPVLPKLEKHIQKNLDSKVFRRNTARGLSSFYIIHDSF